jgi:hypothetical protein
LGDEEILLIEDDESIPLQPLSEIIVKFKRQRRIVDLLMLLALPSAVVAIFIFLVFAAVLSFSTLALIAFGSLAFSAVVSYAANLYIPSALTKVIRSLELTVQGVSFVITPIKGETPAQRILNQLARTDHYVKNVVRKNPNSAQLDALVKGRSGKDYVFDVYIHNVNSLGRLVGDQTDMNLFVKRFDEVDPITVGTIRNLREDVQDSLSRVGRRFPTRVLAISVSGFDDSVFEYVRSKEGSFGSRYMPILCRIELVKEKVDGSYDVLSF